MVDFERYDIEIQLLLHGDEDKANLEGEALASLKNHRNIIGCMISILILTYFMITIHYFGTIMAFMWM